MVLTYFNNKSGEVLALPACHLNCIGEIISAITINYTSNDLCGVNNFFLLVHHFFQEIASIFIGKTRHIRKKINKMDFSCY